MDVTSLCSRLLVAVMVLMVAQMSQSLSAHSDDRVLPGVSPDRLQFFEYETVIISCEELMGLTGWRVKTRHNRPTNSDICSPPASSCTIKLLRERHSGEFWCEDDEGNITGSINISVTAGSVVLEVPARPVMEGSDVTLLCRKQNSESKHISDFYKDGVPLGMVHGHMTIRNVSKSDEGFYSCSVSGAGRSPESWLTVRKQENEPDKENQSSKDNNTHDNLHSDPHPNVTLWTSVSVSLLIIFLLVLGFFIFQKHKVFSTSTPEDNTVSGSEAADPLRATYAVVTKTNKKGGRDADVTYAQVESFRRENDTSTAGTQPSLTEETALYSLISPRSFSED